MGSRAHIGADAEGGGLGRRAEAVEGNARPSHTRSQPWKDVVRSMFAAAQQSVRVHGVAVDTCTTDEGGRKRICDHGTVARPLEPEPNLSLSLACRASESGLLPRL